MAGAGTGKLPWAHWTMPPPTLSGEQYQLPMWRCVDAGGGGDDVDDGVDRADFVEVDLFDGDVVDFGFGGAEEFEGGMAMCLTGSARGRCG